MIRTLVCLVLLLVPTTLCAQPAGYPFRVLAGAGRTALERIRARTDCRQHWDDVTTDAHEWTHMINNDLVERRMGPTGCYLVYQDWCATLPNPKGVTLAQAADEVPQDERGTRFQLYFVSQRQYFADQPFYIFDELASYHAGAVVAVERKMPERTWDDVAATAEFCNYGAAVLRAVRKGDPHYDLAPACAVWSFVNDQVDALIVAGSEFADIKPAQAHQAKTLARYYERDVLGRYCAKPEYGGRRLRLWPQ